MTDAHYTDDLAPAYALIARQIHQMLSKMEVGEKLVSERQLAKDLGISRVTLRRSLDYFQRQGILRTRPGGGTWLAGPVEPLDQEVKPRSRIIGLLVETIQNSMLARLVHGMEKEATEKNFHLVIAHDYGEASQQLVQLRRMKENGIEGVAIFPDTHQRVDQPDFLSALRGLLHDGMRLVVIDRDAPGVDATCVLGDNVRGSYLATQHLLSRGYRRLALMGFGEVGYTTQRDRTKGFRQALEEAGLDPTPVAEASVGSHDYESIAYDVVKSWIAESKGKLPFDGIVCMQDNMAYGAHLALKEANISVPQQIGLIGYDNLDRELYHAEGLHLSSIDQSPELIGRKIACQLIAQIEERSEHKKQYLHIEPSLIVRESSGRKMQRPQLLTHKCEPTAQRCRAP